MDRMDYFSTPLTEKLFCQSKVKKHYSICLWSDLLGFGSPLKRANWQPTDEVWSEAANRLFWAQREFISMLGSTAKLLVLNDGLGCAIDIDNKNMGYIAVYIMYCIRTHMYINTLERKLNLPGARSVLACGERIDYIIPEIKLDDYVIRYSRPDPTDMSALAKRLGNPTLVSIPNEFQMNTAFSKAFLIDEAGSKQGISGNGLFIDQSFFEFVNHSIPDKHQISWEEQESGITYRAFAVPDEQKYVHFGFKMSKGINVTNGEWHTNAYQIKDFSPPDEELPFEMDIDENYYSFFSLMTLKEKGIDLD